MNSNSSTTPLITPVDDAPTSIASDTNLTNKIRKELVEVTYYDDIKYNIHSRSRWKIIGDTTEAIAHIFTGITAILAFAAGFFNFAMFSFIAGCLGTASLVLLQFSSYAMKESKERTEQVNRMLTSLGIDRIVDITIDSTSENTPLISHV